VKEADYELVLMSYISGSVPEAIIGVAPAATVDVKRLRALADIDLLITDAPSAYRELDRLIRLRG
jgi:hypothetical protein